MAVGRPRTFDIDQALDDALEVFWRRGYEGASVADLTEAMGIGAPSLYAAFGNKEALFRKALGRYVERRSAAITAALAAPRARDAIERTLRTMADMLTDPECPRGCMTVQGALTCEESPDVIREALSAERAQGEAAIRRRLERAAAEGDLPAGADPVTLARFVATVAQGMCVQSSGDATRAQLHAVVDMAMRAWAGLVSPPGSPPAAPSR